jgi:hypothetical protein
MTPGTAAMLGVPPALGRWFTDDEERAGGHVLVLSDAMWQRYFGGRRDALGAAVRFTGTSLFVGPIALGTPYTIVGVMPRGFPFPRRPHRILGAGPADAGARPSPPHLDVRGASRRRDHRGGDGGAHVDRAQPSAAAPRRRRRSSRRASSSCRCRTRWRRRSGRRCWC